MGEGKDNDDDGVDRDDGVDGFDGFDGDDVDDMVDRDDGDDRDDRDDGDDEDDVVDADDGVEGDNDDECEGEVSAWLHQISQMAFENRGGTKSRAIFQGEFVSYYLVEKQRKYNSRFNQICEFEAEAKIT